MDFKTTKTTAEHLYRATTALLDTFSSSGSHAVTGGEIQGILSTHSDKMSIASVTVSGVDRAVNIVTELQENLFPPLPVKRIISGAILVIYNGGDLTTEEYLLISNRLLGTLPDDIQTIVSLSQNGNVGNSIKGTLLILWQ